MNLVKEIDEAYKYIKSKSKYNPKIGIVLGSGLGDLANEIKEAEYYKYMDIPNFTVPTIDGHEGTLIIGKLYGKEVVAMKGRCHYYEGHSMQRLTLPIRVMKLLGVETLIVTNCAGQAKESIEAGDLVVIKNHLNFTGENPLRGENLAEFGDRFPDLAYPYDKELREKAKNIAKKLNINLKEGIYAMFPGPSYETASETLMAAALGADVVGMSTVPEVIVANHSGIKVLGFSGVPCLAAAYSDAEISHQEVLENFKGIAEKCTAIVSEFLKEF
ncbi:methylthioadenosine phosphorylase [Clostridium cavendishii DSM 21758]|uniref:Purine nucleoside phosphorylase n=1 Tax=Clostridium cavendishii DSM 21758 TaxID=1121302 RepID=A0A1M6GHQ4_9CLOT|nr:purine-nucleoside phosphorylase [Clostridium cavendishii]SHJ09476.1 methylthioadenosine phosphorylase [Clostridium cavendishii DSM 21758]